MTIQLERQIPTRTQTDGYNYSLVPRPEGLDDSLIIYNPSAIWTVEDASGQRNIIYARVEPDRADSTTSHLGKSWAIPYIINVERPEPLVPYGDAMAVRGEDPALTRILRTLPSGAIESAWLLSCVDARPFKDRPNMVETLVTKFYAGRRLDELELVAEGPPWMKDIRVSQLPDGRLGVYGRPQPTGNYSGNISYTEVPNLSHLTPEAIANASIIDETLFPVGSGLWGGVNDVIRADTSDASIALLLAHRARRTGENGNGRNYEAVIYKHNVTKRTVVELGILATADQFPAGAVKADETVDTSGVAFPGGGYNGTLSHMTIGVSDANVGLRSRSY